MVVSTHHVLGMCQALKAKWKVKMDPVPALVSLVREMKSNK